MYSDQESNSFLNFLLLFKDAVKHNSIVVAEQLDALPDFRDDNIYKTRHLCSSEIGTLLGTLLDQYSMNIERYNDIVDGDKAIMKELNKLIDDNCSHEWDTDYIDIGMDTSDRIEYCTHCNMTRL